jgi:hypothetical protein
MSYYVRDIILFNQNISFVYHIVCYTCDLNIVGTRMETLVSFLKTGYIATKSLLDLNLCAGLGRWPLNRRR